MGETPKVSLSGITVMVGGSCLPRVAHEHDLIRLGRGQGTQKRRFGRLRRLVQDHHRKLQRIANRRRLGNQLIGANAARHNDGRRARNHFLQIRRAPSEFLRGGRARLGIQECHRSRDDARRPFRARFLPWPRRCDAGHAARRTRVGAPRTTRPRRRCYASRPVLSTEQIYGRSGRRPRQRCRRR